MTARLSKKKIAAAVAIVEMLLRQGFAPPDGSRRANGIYSAAGRIAEERKLATAGNGRHWLRHAIKVAEGNGAGPDWTIKKPKPKKRATPPRRSVAAEIVARGPRWPGCDKGKTLRIGVIPDVHVAPDHSSERLEWIGRFFADEAPDHLVQLGDFGTFDSVSGHAPPGTLDFEKLPRVTQDFQCVEGAVDILKKGLGNWRGELHITKGNHEFRLDRFENANPQIQGLLVDRFDSLMQARGFRVYPFRKYAMIGGVGFIHIPINAGGKPYGGKMSAHAIARDALFSIVHGHTHVRQSTHVAKLGESKLVSVISPGCALPMGHVEDYAKHSATGWFWGVSCLTVRDGVILDESHISMETLERRYRSRKVVRSARSGRAV